MSAQPRRTYANFQTVDSAVSRRLETRNKPNLLRLCVSFILAFIPCPAFGECVWHASPAMKTRSLTENCDATR